MAPSSRDGNVADVETVLFALLVLAFLAIALGGVHVVRRLLTR